jgi:hypothetical protein
MALEQKSHREKKKGKQGKQAIQYASYIEALVCRETVVLLTQFTIYYYWNLIRALLHFISPEVYD